MASGLIISEKLASKPARQVVFVGKTVYLTAGSETNTGARVARCTVVRVRASWWRGSQGQEWLRRHWLPFMPSGCEGRRSPPEHGCSCGKVRARLGVNVTDAARTSVCPRVCYDKRKVRCFFWESVAVATQQAETEGLTQEIASSQSENMWIINIDSEKIMRDFASNQGEQKRISLDIYVVHNMVVNICGHYYNAPPWTVATHFWQQCILPHHMPAVAACMRLSCQPLGGSGLRRQALQSGDHFGCDCLPVCLKNHFFLAVVHQKVKSYNYFRKLGLLFFQAEPQVEHGARWW